MKLKVLHHIFDIEFKSELASIYLLKLLNLDNVDKILEMKRHPDIFEIVEVV